MITLDDIAMRTIVDIPDDQLRALARLCEQQKISRAEAVRRALDRLLEEASLGSKEKAFGIWKHKRMNSRKFIDELRSEWALSARDQKFQGL